MSPVEPFVDEPFRERYQIERELGRGGMATVYLARDLRHERAVAIKVLRPDVAAEIGTERFLREIRLAAQLHHPHILPLYDSGTLDPGPMSGPARRSYYVMPYIEGESLRTRLERERRLVLTDALRIGREVADALEYAHRHDIVHRDIKPENILLEGYLPDFDPGSGWHALVADFGIARAIAARDVPLTATGLAIGTPTYMSPEQVFGEAELDGRSDLYSLGCVLFEMLTGEPPFTGPTSQAIMTMRCVEVAPRLRSLRPDVPAAVDEAVHRALARMAADRFPTAAQFGDALAMERGQSGGYAHTVESRSPPLDSHAIAVLPFVNMSPEKENEYFSDGMAEELTAALARVRGLRVAARSSAFSFKGKDVDARTIGQRLKVDSLVEGSVRKLGNRIRLTAQLVDALTGYQRWSETYERTMEDVFALQEELSRAIVGALPLAPPSQADTTLVRPATDNLEAYTLYLRGRYFTNRRTLESLKIATEYFEQATERDSSYAPAYAGLGECWTLRGLVEWDDPELPLALPRAKQAALQSIALSPGLHEARGWLAAVHMLYDWDWPLAEAEFRRATESQPENSRAHLWYAIYLGAMGRHQESLARILRAQVLDPVSLPIHQIVARCYVWSGDYDTALEHLRTAREMEPGHPLTSAWTARALSGKGLFHEALEELRKAMAVAGRLPLLLALAGRAYGELGMRAEALGVLEHLRQESGRRHISPILAALVAGSVGDRDEAFRLYDLAYEQRSSDLAFLRVPNVSLPDKSSTIRSDPRFQELLRKMQLDC